MTAVQLDAWKVVLMAAQVVVTLALELAAEMVVV